MEERNANPEQTAQELIVTAGTTQARVAQNLGVSQQTVNAWLNRRKVPRADNFFALCRELGISAKRLGKLLQIDVSGVPDDDQEEGN